MAFKMLDLFIDFVKVSIMSTVDFAGTVQRPYVCCWCTHETTEYCDGV